MAWLHLYEALRHESQTQKKTSGPETEKEAGELFKEGEADGQEEKGLAASTQGYCHVVLYRNF